VGESFVAYGVRLGLRGQTSAALLLLRGHLPPNARSAGVRNVDRLYSLVLGGDGPRPGVRRLHILYADHVRIARSEDLDTVLSAFESEVEGFVGVHAPARVFVHAGVVGWRGRAIVIPGRSFSGKSTLVRALLDAGATYYSDEYAVIDMRGRVHPYDRPLSLRTPGAAPGVRPSRHEPESLGVRRGRKALPIGLIIATRFSDGARFRPRPASAGEGVLALLSNTLSARMRPKVAMIALREAVGGARVLKGRRGEAAETVQQILSIATAPSGRRRDVASARNQPTGRAQRRRHGRRRT